ncbi:hypothetical protein LOAG_09748 [Loa loa]|uniref:Uncharacterized protein n=1 Tax=Loa loa TaxID=7209 RepID=A0A1S0TR90_LOALO|nr:hypothetical protein LOAG_09748 [Loa loa]EFO18747.1 hypothetical protein LOAG_09748 [Loa loa]
MAIFAISSHLPSVEGGPMSIDYLLWIPALPSFMCLFVIESYQFDVDPGPLHKLLFLTSHTRIPKYFTSAPKTDPGGYAKRLWTNAWRMTQPHVPQEPLSTTFSFLRSHPIKVIAKNPPKKPLYWHNARPFPLVQALFISMSIAWTTYFGKSKGTSHTSHT